MVHGPYSVTYPNHTPIFEWCVIKCEYKNKTKNVDV